MAAKDTLSSSRLGSQAKSKPVGVRLPGAYGHGQSRGDRQGTGLIPSPNRGLVVWPARQRVRSGHLPSWGVVQWQDAGLWHQSWGFDSLRPSPFAGLPAPRARLLCFLVLRVGGQGRQPATAV